MAKILITGGCGYIGSHTIVDLIENGYEVISIDNLINSSESVLDGIQTITGKSVKNHAIDLCDLQSVKNVFEAHDDIYGIIHFAALKNVGESVEQPLRYYENNIVGLINLLKCQVEYQVAQFVFSSSCSVYGNVNELPVVEDHPIGSAESPYARTKQMSEFIIQDLAVNGELKYALLRYFNPAGAHHSIEIGESPINPALNLVPVITETAIGDREKTVVFGNDYPTRDGSCVRDYIHIEDLANAHTKALQYLESQNHGVCEIINLGTGEGTTVLEAIQAFESVTGRRLNYEIGPRRPGDVIAVYADNKKANELIQWSPKRSIEDIMDSAWKWELKRRG